MSQVNQEVWHAVISSWEANGANGVANVEHNFNVLKSALTQAMQKGVPPTKENWQAVVNRCWPRLQFLQQTQGVLQLPHENVPELRDIRTLADVRRIKRLSKEQLQKYKRLDPSAAWLEFHHLNERLAYIIEHKIDGPETQAGSINYSVKDGEVFATNITKQAVEYNHKTKTYDLAEQKADNTTPEYAKARQMIADIHPRDIRSRLSDGGGIEAAEKARTRLTIALNNMIRTKQDPAAVLRVISKEIDDLSSTSIR